MNSTLSRVTLLAISLSFAGCTRGPEGEPRSTPRRVFNVGSSGSAVLVGAGDIADCDSKGAEATAKLLDEIDGIVFTAGDNAYPSGSAEEFRRCYEPTWGRHKDRTVPAVGNHEYRTWGASAYYDYFGTSAGNRGDGWHSFDLAGWHVVVLNSYCKSVSCKPDSQQVRWLKADLAASKAKCTMAIWHHPRWGSGRQETAVQPLWDALEAHGAELIVNGHDHFYERLAPLTPAGKPAPAGDGIRQFTVGTGGRKLDKFKTAPGPPSDARDNDTHGVLKLTLAPGRYDWEFVPVPGETFRDSGSATCR